MNRLITILLCLSLIVPSLADTDGEECKLIVYHSDNLSVLKSLPDKCINLIYIDPPFNTGVRQDRKRFKTEDGERKCVESFGFDDDYNDYIGFLEPRIREAYRILAEDGSSFVHLDYREVQYVKVMMDQIFGRKAFINEIIWVYDFGGRSKLRWSPKHDNILWYVKNPKKYTYNYAAIDRIPYMAPGIVSEEKASRGKTPTDVWWHTIVSPTGKEKTGYATQKPLAITDRIIAVHSNKNDLCLDFFAGSGTFGASAYNKGRNCILIDSNSDAITVMRRRFDGLNVIWNVESNAE